MKKSTKNKIISILRFKETNGQQYPEWQVVILNTLAKLVSRKNKDTKVNRVLTNSAANGIVDQRDFFEKEIANSSNLEGYYVVEIGDYVYNSRISNIAPVGPVSKNKIGRGVMSPLYTVFRFNSNKNDFYDQYFKTSHWHQYLRSVSNTGARFDRMSITPSVFITMPVPFPNPEEQQKIADFLFSLDELIIAENGKLEALKVHKKGLMQQLFPAEGETVPKLRFAEFRDSGEWEEKTLKGVCKMQAGKFVSASDISENNSNNLFPCYGGNGLRGYTKTYTHSGLYPLVGRQGALCGNVMLAKGNFHATEHAVVCTPKESVDIVWLYYLLKHLNLNHYATGQAQPGLSVDNLEKVDTKIPDSLEEQQKIAECLSSLDELITEQAQKIEALTQHKKGLLQGLFPGAANT